MYAHKQKNIPKLPRTCDEVVLEGEWIKDGQGNRFLLNHVKEENKNLIIVRLDIIINCLLFTLGIKAICFHVCTP
jgi:hypothetical protein